MDVRRRAGINLYKGMYKNKIRTFSNSDTKLFSVRTYMQHIEFIIHTLELIHDDAELRIRVRYVYVDNCAINMWTDAKTLYL